MRQRKTSGQTLVASLVVIAIIAILAVALLGGSRGPSPRKDGQGSGPAGLTRLAAKDEVCRNNLGQMRASILIARTNADDQPPATLAECGLSETYQKCAIGGEAYVYDPSTGTVTCPHQGHEKY